MARRKENKKGKAREISPNVYEVQESKKSAQQQSFALQPSARVLRDNAPNSSTILADNVWVTDLQRNCREPPISRVKEQVSDDLAPYEPSTSSIGLCPPLHARAPNVISGGFLGSAKGVLVSGGSFEETHGARNSVTVNFNVKSSREEEHDIPQQRQPSPQPSTSITIYSPDNSNRIYERHLEPKGRGFPLWNPGPSRTLSMDYQRRGIDIGDVGIITPSGGFSFLFNICLPPDHPINPRTLPEGFTPIYPLIEREDICEYSAFNPGSHLASAIKEIHDPQFPGLSFATSAAEGAVLTLPDGAMARDLENLLQFRAYVAANIESWYRYANVIRGREVKNGDIRLVYGCDKATSWGMAAVANMTEHETHYLKYRSVAEVPIPLYTWEKTGLAEARVGPELREIENLKRNDDSDVAVDGRYWNQSLFIRTLNVMVNNDVFAEIEQEVEIALTQKSQQYRNKGGSSSSTSHPPNTSTQTGQQSGATSINQTGFTSAPLGSAAQNLAINDVARERASISRSPSAPTSHPSEVLNKLLLEKVPNSRVVVTEDKIWCSVIKDVDKTMPSCSEISERVLATHHIRNEHGVVFLEPKMAAQFVDEVPGCDSTLTKKSSLEDHLLSRKRRCKECHKQLAKMDVPSEHLWEKADTKCTRVPESASWAGSPAAMAAQVGMGDSGMSDKMGVAGGDMEEGVLLQMVPCLSQNVSRNGPPGGLLGGSFSAVHGDMHIHSSSLRRYGMELLIANIAQGTSYDATERGNPPRCHPTTRSAIRAEIMERVKAPETYRKPILWLYGRAGAGMTVIAQTIAEECAKGGLLAASFFSHRGKNNALRFVATLAYQLSLSIPEICEPILAAIENDPAIFSRTLSVQMQVLIVTPLESLKGSARQGPRVVVVDALDEIGPDGQSQAQLPHVLGAAVSKLYHNPIIFLISSRLEYESDNHLAFKTYSLKSIDHVKPWTPKDAFHETLEKLQEIPSSPWEIAYKNRDQYDKGICAAWRDEIDKLVIFAGLFSAIIVTFLTISYPMLKPDPSNAQNQFYVDLYVFWNAVYKAKLNDISDVQLPVPPNLPSSNVFWFLSLTLALGVVLFGTLCLRWIREYERNTRKCSKEGFAVRQMRFDGLQFRKVSFVLYSLPIILQSSLLLFFWGLLTFLWTLNNVTIMINTVITIILFFVFATINIPTVQRVFRSSEKMQHGHQCAYKSLQARIFAPSIFSTLVPIIKFMIEGRDFLKQKLAFLVKFTRGRDWVPFDDAWHKSRLILHPGAREIMSYDLPLGLAWLGNTYAHKRESYHTLYHFIHHLHHSTSLNISKELGIPMIMALQPTWSTTGPQYDNILADIFCAFLFDHKAKNNQLSASLLLHRRVELLVRIANHSLAVPETEEAKSIVFFIDECLSKESDCAFNPFTPDYDYSTLPIIFKQQLLMTFSKYLTAATLNPVIWSIVKPMSFQIIASFNNADLSLVPQLSSLNEKMQEYFEHSKPKDFSELELTSAFEFIRYLFHFERKIGSRKLRQHHFLEFSDSLTSFKYVLERYIKDCAGAKANFMNEVNLLLGKKADSAEFREYFESFYPGSVNGARSGKQRRLSSVPLRSLFRRERQFVYPPVSRTLSIPFTNSKKH